jgi:hypothetical protein
MGVPRAGRKCEEFPFEIFPNFLDSRSEARYFNPELQADVRGRRESLGLRKLGVDEIESKLSPMFDEERSPRPETLGKSSLRCLGDAEKISGSGENSKIMVDRRNKC